MAGLLLCAAYWEDVPDIEACDEPLRPSLKARGVDTGACILDCVLDAIPLEDAADEMNPE